MSVLALTRADRIPGRLLRLPLRLIPRGASVPILATAARGKRWIAGSGPHSCWLGFNEMAKRRCFEREVRPGSVVYDVGANVGSYTILASVLAGPAGRVIAFEPVAENVGYLREHVSINGLTNVEIREAAVGARAGRAAFQPHRDRLQGALDANGTQDVSVLALDGLVARGDVPPPACIKIDVEGGEAGVLAGALETLRTHRPIVFLATHGDAVRSECSDLLATVGYGMHAIGRRDDEWIARPSWADEPRPAATARMNIARPRTPA
jgi:FkbM family methyltransferase